MTLEAVLASLHLVAILTLVVFMSSQAALCRIEWLNAAVVERLVRLDVIYNVTALVLLLTGLARVVWGIKGFGAGAASCVPPARCRRPARWGRCADWSWCSRTSCPWLPSLPCSGRVAGRQAP